jgi:hypothetical protein
MLTGSKAVVVGKGGDEASDDDKSGSVVTARGRGRGRGRGAGRVDIAVCN